MHGPVPETERLPGVPGLAAPGLTAPRRPSRARRWAATAFFALSLVALFTAYLRLSRTYPENSDEANILLMASDMLHGNVYLSGWNVSDVPFITTELPEIALLVKLFGLHLNTAHIAAAFTYTVVVAVSMMLAKGRTRGPEAIIRMGIALAIVLAPQPGVGVFVMIFSVGHIGTAAPVMLAWLVLDRFPGRRYVPVIVGLLLAWALTADPLVLVIAVCPLLAVSLPRVVTDFTHGTHNGSALRRVRHVFASRRRETSLAVAAGLACLLAWAGGRLLRVAAGGYAQQPVPFTLDPPGTWYPHALVAAHGLLEMFGAYPRPGNAVNYLGPGNYVAAPPLSGLAEAVAVTRLACVALAALGACVTARRFFRRDADLVSQLLLAGVIANLAAYIPSSLADHTALNAREFAPVLPFAAVLAARMGCARPSWTKIAWDLRSRRRDQVLAAALAVLLGWYCLGLFEESRIPAAPDPFAKLEAFLIGHRLTDGIGGYWDSSVITVDTGGTVTIRAVTQGCLQPYAWESKPAWYDPARHAAGFVLESGGTGYFSQWRASPAALRQLGTLPYAAGRATLHPGGGYLVQAYRGNLLAQLPLLTRCQHPGAG